MYAFDDAPGADRRELQRRALIVLNYLEEQEAVVLVPTIALAEFLVAYPPSRHGPLVAELSGTFLFPPCDVHAAAIAAEVWQKHQTFSEEHKIKRAFLKADALIVATAKAAGAERIYSNDVKFLRLADAVKLPAFDLPTHHEDIFKDHESRTTK